MPVRNMNEIFANVMQVIGRYTKVMQCIGGCLMLCHEPVGM